MKKYKTIILVGVVTVGIVLLLKPHMNSTMKYLFMNPEERERSEQNSTMWYECSSTAYDKYIDEWNRECKAVRLHNECELNIDTMDPLLNTLRVETEECGKLYPW